MSTRFLSKMCAVLGRFSGLMLLLALLGMGQAMAAAPLAGTVIRNTATATYTQSAASHTLSSNTVEATVLPVESITLVPDLQVQGVAGDVITLVHTLSNNGNIDTRVTLTFSNLTNDNFDLSGLKLIQDLNNNGVADPGEPVLSPGAQLPLAVGQSISLILTGTVPSDVSAGDISRLQVNGVATLGSTAQVNDTVTIAAYTPPTLVKSASVSSALPGGVVAYTLNLTVGNGVMPRTVTVDGSSRQLVVVRDAIPLNTVFASVSLDGGSLVLYQVTGAGADQYQSTPPGDLSTVTAIAFGFSSLAAKSQRSMQFLVRVVQNPTGSISNTGILDATLNGKPGTVPSNPVVVTIPPKDDGKLEYRDPPLDVPLTNSSANVPLNLWATASACNADSTVAEKYFVTLTSTLTGDVEHKFQMTETGPSTGIFTITGIPTARTPPATVTADDGTMQVALNDIVHATLVCGSKQLDADIKINPAGVVYDSSNDKPIKGAQVLLIDMSNGATLYTVTTDADGVFEFPLAGAGIYRFQVLPPDGFVFPSISPNRYADRHLDDNGSFNKPFDAASTAGLAIDIPLDPKPAVLTVEKTVSRDTAEIGETVTYTVIVHNRTARDLEDITLDDVSPFGFTLVAGTVRKNGVAIANPAIAGRKLSFPIGHMDANQSITLTYVALLGTNASSGDGINRAMAHNDTVVSNIGTAKVKVEKGVFGDQAVIVGKIFVDCNRNDLQDAEELGIPGVRMYLDDGTYVISDEEGKYSLYGISPRTHVLKIDRTTLPAGSEMETVSNRNAGDPQSRFIDLKNGEMHRADFAEGSCTPEILKLVKERRKEGEVRNAKVDDATLQDDGLLQPLNTGAQVVVDPRTQPAAGVIGANGKIVADTSRAGPSSLSATAVERNSTSALGPAPLAATASVNLEALLPKLKDNKFGFLDLKDGDTLPGSDVAVRLVGRDGSQFALFVNDVEIPAKRVGQRAHMPSRDVQAWEYIGVKLKPGVNTLRAENRDTFGNVHESAEIKLTAPGSAGKLVMVMPPDGAVADGQTPARIMVRLLDADNVPVTARTFITLESSDGRWDVEDLDPKQPGVQTVIQGGEALFDLIPPSQPGNADLRVSSGELEGKGRLPLNAHLRPLIASGIIEGAIGFNKLSSKAVVPADENDGFEQAIKSMNGDGANGGVRGSMFLKGKVKGNYLLTLAYDSDKDTQDRMFRDIDPENYYPIYGDSSIKGFDAQSTSKLYVRVDKGRSYLLYGDFNTNEQSAGSSSQARQLSNFSRSLTGVREHYETDKVLINLFASHGTSQQQNTEFRAQGISGPYQLPGGHLVINSEKIEVITRDRNQPSIVVQTVPLNRFVDYTIDEIKGAIIFTQPISGVDAQLNPVFIRVTWEVESGGEAYWVYGADGTYHLTNNLDVGASVVRDNTPDASTTLYGANASLALSKDSKATVEVAHSQDDATDTSGTAWRAEVTQSGAGGEGRIYVTQSDGSFQNPNAALTAGSREAGIKGGLKLTDKMRLAVDGLYSDSASTGGGAREGVFGRVEYALMSNLKWSLGARFTHQEETTATPATPTAPATQLEATNGTSVNTKLSWNPGFMPKAGVYAEYEQSVDEASARALGVGGSYQIADRSRIYVKHELISSTTGPFGLSELSQDQNSTAVGIDYDYMKNGNAFSEYRVRDALDGPEAQAALGLKNRWTLRPGLKLSTQFERVEPLGSNDLNQRNTAVSVGLQYSADPLLRAGTRLEWRQSDTEKNLLSTVALARKLSLDWSILGKNTLSWTNSGASTITATDDDTVGGLVMSGPTIRDRLRMGAAWRQTDKNEWSWLGLYELRYDRDPSIEQRRTAHILSSNFNYQPDRQWVFSGRYAAKLVNENNFGISDRFFGNLISGRAMFDISEKWDAGLIGSVLFDQRSLNYGIGAELGYLITSNLWLSGGYNFTGYEDKDFDASNSTRRGLYMRLRFKFDEEMFRWLE